jgi:DNA-directed RNA polymerase specialized sigma24 family protein
LAQRPTLRIDSDEVLVARARAGAEGAFEILLTRYQKQLYQLAQRGTRDAVDAEEITHTILTRAYRELGAFDPETSFRSWLYGIAARELALRYGAARARARRATTNRRRRPRARPHGVPSCSSPASRACSWRRLRAAWRAWQ